VASPSDVKHEWIAVTAGRGNLWLNALNQSQLRLMEAIRRNLRAEETDTQIDYFVTLPLAS
jgi:hypothetical protein